MGVWGMRVLPAGSKSKASVGVWANFQLRTRQLSRTGPSCATHTGGWPTIRGTQVRSKRTVAWDPYMWYLRTKSCGMPPGIPGGSGSRYVNRLYCFKDYGLRTV